MANQALFDGLMQVLANSYALYIKSHNYHWNVTGPQFHSLHSLFEEQYSNLATAVDSIAERAREIGHKVPASFDHFAKISKVGAGDENASSEQMIKDLMVDHETVIQSLKALLATSQQENDPATEDLCVERLEFHEKAAWMLASSL